MQKRRHAARGRIVPQLAPAENEDVAPARQRTAT